jgi:hypothetical protein
MKARHPSAAPSRLWRPGALVARQTPARRHAAPPRRVLTRHPGNRPAATPPPLPIPHTMKAVGSRQAACAQHRAFSAAGPRPARAHRGRIAPLPAFGPAPAPAQQQARRSAAARAVRADQQVDQLDAATLQLISSLSGAADAQLAAAIKQHTEAAKSMDASTNSVLREKIVDSIAQLSKGLLERETEVGMRAVSASGSRQRAPAPPSGRAPRSPQPRRRTAPPGRARRSACCCSRRCAASTSCCSARQVRPRGRPPCARSRPLARPGAPLTPPPRRPCARAQARPSPSCRAGCTSSAVATTLRGC